MHKRPGATSGLALPAPHRLPPVAWTTPFSGCRRSPRRNRGLSTRDPRSGPDSAAESPSRDMHRRPIPDRGSGWRGGSVRSAERGGRRTERRSMPSNTSATSLSSQPAPCSFAATSAALTAEMTAPDSSASSTASAPGSSKTSAGTAVASRTNRVTYSLAASARRSARNSSTTLPWPLRWARAIARARARARASVRSVMPSSSRETVKS